MSLSKDRDPSRRNIGKNLGRTAVRVGLGFVATAMVATACDRDKKPVSTLTPDTSTPTAQVVATDETIGEITEIDCQSIRGWATTTVPNFDGVRIYADGSEASLYAKGGIFSGTANIQEDVSGRFQFTIPVIEPLKDGKLHEVSVYRTSNGGWTNQELGNSPQTLICPPDR